MSVTSTMEAVQTSVRMTMEASLVHVVQGMSLSLEIAVISSTQSGHAKVHNSGVCIGEINFGTIHIFKGGILGLNVNIITVCSLPANNYAIQVHGILIMSYAWS